MAVDNPTRAICFVEIFLGVCAVGTDGVDAGTAGLVPAPATTDAGKYLKADGTWDTVSAGPNVVQTTGTSQTDVMSQVATSQLVYPSGEETSKSKIRIGDSSRASRPYDIAIGYDAYASTNGNGYNISIGYAAGQHSGVNKKYRISIGASAESKNDYSIALGSSSVTTRDRELSIGTSSYTRYVANVTDPTLAQDAATKNYVDTQVGNIETILQSINSGQGVGV